MPIRSTDASEVAALRKEAKPLTDPTRGFDDVIEAIGDARYVLLGEATHGTHEFYAARAEITRRLIREKGFTVIAWEADWPDTLMVNRFVQGRTTSRSADKALAGFQRFPTWMWRNRDILELVTWLRDWNANRPRASSRVGVYGLDLYSLHTSIDAVLQYLDGVDPQAAREARHRYGCFESFGPDPQEYGRIASRDRSRSCEDEVVQQLMELRRKATEFLSRNGRVAADEQFFAEQNARVARSAESYYRAMFNGHPDTWNLRDTHMTDTLDQLMAHLRRQAENPRAVVWAHNSHLGDARATEMGRRGEINVGQLMRERHGAEVFSLGFTTYYGTVTAASHWDGAAELKRVRPALEDSYEALFHHTGLDRFSLLLRTHGEAQEILEAPRLERAIGVIYQPQTERWSHYFEASLSRQFDAVIHFDETRAVEPLEPALEWSRGELPETFPSGV